MKRLAICLLFLAQGMQAETHLPFIADDYGKALAEAKQRKLPIFVEVSAPW